MNATQDRDQRKMIAINSGSGYLGRDADIALALAKGIPAIITIDHLRPLEGLRLAPDRLHVNRDANYNIVDLTIDGVSFMEATEPAAAFTQPIADQPSHFHIRQLHWLPLLDASSIFSITIQRRSDVEWKCDDEYHGDNAPLGLCTCSHFYAAMSCITVPSHFDSKRVRGPIRLIDSNTGEPIDVSWTGPWQERIRPAQRARFTARPFRDVRIEHIVMDYRWRQWSVNDIQVDGKTEFIVDSSLPGEAFAPGYENQCVDMAPVLIGHELAFEVSYQGGATRDGAAPGERFWGVTCYCAVRR